MARPMTIDFVSDVSCPGCIIGLRGFDEALARTGDIIQHLRRPQPGLSAEIVVWKRMATH
jgi:predicted DsbA family dithiol-disulfide isomerase